MIVRKTVNFMREREREREKMSERGRGEVKKIEI